MMNATINTTTSQTPQSSTSLKYQDILIGSIMSIGGNLLISISLNLQKYVHMRNESSGGHEHYSRIPMWWLGIFLMVLGETGNFTAYGFAPASMVAPLGTTTVIANMIIAVIFLHEVMRPEDLFGSVLSIVGAFLIVSYSKHNHPVENGEIMMHRIISPTFIIYASVAITLLLICLVLHYGLKVSNVLILLLICNLLASFTVISAKGVSALFQLTVSGTPQWKYPVFYILFVVLAVTAVLQVIFLNKAMKENYSTVVVPTNFVFFTIAAIVGGVVFFNEFSGLHALDIFMFFLGCILSFVGVFFIQFNRDVDGRAVEPSLSQSDLTDSDALLKTERPKVFSGGLPSWGPVSTQRKKVQPTSGAQYQPIDAMAAPLRRSLPNIALSDVQTPQHIQHEETETFAAEEKNHYGTT